MNKVLGASALVANLVLSGFIGVEASPQAAPAAARSAGAYVCDIAYEDCRQEVLTLIKNETVGIDVSFWFMTDARYSNELVKKALAGVPVRVIMDPRANTSKPANAAQFDAAAHQHQPHPGPDRGVVVDEQDADLRTGHGLTRSGRGRRVEGQRRVYPPDLAVALAVSSPPRSAARSRMDTRPVPAFSAWWPDPPYGSGCW